MPLVNLTDLVVIGPGSEWFWTAVSGIVVAVTFLAIYRQLRMQRAAHGFAQMQELEDRMSTAHMLQLKLRLALALKRGDDPDTDVLVGGMAAFFENVGFLHRQRYLSTDALANTHNAPSSMPCAGGPSWSRASSERRPNTDPASSLTSNASQRWAGAGWQSMACRSSRPILPPSRDASTGSSMALPAGCASTRRSRAVPSRSSQRPADPHHR